MKKIVIKLVVFVFCMTMVIGCSVLPVYATPFDLLDKDELCIKIHEMHLKRLEEQQKECNELREKLVDYACSFAGDLPYVYGGHSLETGTDCSGFVHLIYETYGMSVPRTASEFQAMGNISENELELGDIVAYNWGEHCGIYIGDGKIVHAANPDSDTLIADMYCMTPTAFVRIIQ